MTRFDGASGKEGGGEEDVGGRGKMDSVSNETPALVPNDLDGAKDGHLKNCLSAGSRPVTSGTCLVCGLDVVTDSPGFRTSTVVMDASRLPLEERIAKIFGLPSLDVLRAQETVTCARCLAIIFRVDFLEVELPRTKAHVRYLYSKNRAKVFELPPVAPPPPPAGTSSSSSSSGQHGQGHFGMPSSGASLYPRSGSSSQLMRQPQQPPLYPTGLMNALSQPLSSSVAGAAAAAAGSSASSAMMFNKRPSLSSAEPSPPSSPSGRGGEHLRSLVGRKLSEASADVDLMSLIAREAKAEAASSSRGGDEDERMSDEVSGLEDGGGGDDGGARKRKRPVPPMRPILDKKPNENGLEARLNAARSHDDASVHEDDDADETPRKLSRHELEQRLRGNGTTSPAPSKSSSVAEGELDLTASEDGDHRHMAAAAAAAARRYHGSDLSALVGAHADFASIEGAIAERLKASSSGSGGAAGGLTAEELGLMTAAAGFGGGGGGGGGGKHQGNQLDSSSANILNSLSSLSSLVGADPTGLGLGGLGMRGFPGRNPLLSRGLRMSSSASSLNSLGGGGGGSSSKSDDYSFSGFGGSDSHAKCWLCHLDCRTYKKVEEHFKKEHPGETPFVCEKCGGEFRDLSSYRNHVYYENRKEKLAKGQIKPKSGHGSSGSAGLGAPSPGPGRRSGRLSDFPASLLTGAVDPTSGLSSSSASAAASSSSSSAAMRCEICKLPFNSESALKDHYLKEHAALLGLGGGVGAGAGAGSGSSDSDFPISMEQYALYSQALLNAHKEYVMTQQKEAAVHLQRQLQQMSSSSGAANSGSTASTASNSSSGGGGGKSGSSGGGGFVCDECNASFRSKEALSIHKFQDHGAKDSLLKLFS